MSITIGLDIGATAVRAARLTDRGAVIPDGARIPAVACATAHGFVVGDEASALTEARPDRAVRSFLHLLGAVERPLTLAADEASPTTPTDPAPTAKQVVSALVAKAVAAAVPEAPAAGADIRAVVAVRPSVPLRHRLALADAVRRAGVEVARLVPSTSCAAAATLADAPAGTFLLIDAGGGGLSVALIDTGSGVLDAHYAASTDRVSGEGWHHAVAATIARWIRAETGVDPAGGAIPYARLLAAARAADRELAATGRAVVRVPDYLDGLPAAGPAGAGPSPQADLALQLTTEVWQGPATATAAHLRALVGTALDTADWPVPDLDGAVLVGGAATRPVFADTLSLDLGIAPLPAPSPTDVVAVGAAIVGGVMAGDVHDLLLLHGAAAAYEFDDAAGRTTALLPPHTGVPTRATAAVRPEADFDGTAVTVHFRARSGRTTDPEPVATATVTPRAGDHVLAVADVDANETTVVALAVEGDPVWSTAVSPHVLDAAAARPGGPGRGVVVIGADDDGHEVSVAVAALADLGFDVTTLDPPADDPGPPAAAVEASDATPVVDAVDSALAAAACVVAVITERGATSWRLAQRIGLAARLGRPIVRLESVAAGFPPTDVPTFAADDHGRPPPALIEWLRERPTQTRPGAPA
ncbi:MAG: Hsp70 family protein [Actinomycetota bacterium]